LSVWLARIAAQIHRKLLSAREQSMYVVKHVTDELLRMDLAKMVTTLTQAVGQRPILTRNEARAQIRYLPIDEWDAEDKAAAETMPMDTSSTETPDSIDIEDSPEDTPQDQPQRISDDELLRRRALFSLTARARHKARDAKAFVQWVDSGFKSLREEWATTTTKIEPEFFVQFHADMNKAAESTTADALLSVVDQIATTYERSV
jgi:hypothetical protein